MKLIRNIEEENKNINVIVITIDQVCTEEKFEARVCYLYRKKFVVTADFQIKLLNNAMLNE